MKSRWRLMSLAITMAIAGCEPSASEMGTLTGPMPQSPPPVTVRVDEHHLAVKLTDGLVGDVEWQRIDAFLAGAAKGRPETARLAIAANASTDVIGRLIRHAVASGYAQRNIANISAIDGPPDRRTRHGIVLTVRTYAVVLPNCPQTAHLNVIDGDNMVSSDWGCATVSMLGLQVADPHDLVWGRSGGETDSIMTTAAIRRLETGKVKKLDNPTTTSGSSGASQ